jgi:hypothetical protein
MAAKILKISRTSLYRMLEEANREKLSKELERDVPVFENR